MKNLINNKILAFPVFQNQQDFLLGKFTIKEILTFTRYTQRLIRGYDENNNPIYNEEVQRKVEESRVKKIADFLIYDPEATFPTNLVISIPLQVVDSQKSLENGLIELVLDKKVFDEVEKEKRTPNKGNIFLSIIDGQHRIRGIEVALEMLEQEVEDLAKTLRGTRNRDLGEKLKKRRQRLNDLKDIELIVTFFIDKSLEYQAMIFSTINRTQKRMSQDLVYSLFGLTTADSPQKTALEITLALNGYENSPFFNRVRFYGANYKKNMSPPLSQASMVKFIINLICENTREEEKSRFLPRKELLHRSESSSKNLPFRYFYATNKDTYITKLLNNYFGAVKETFTHENRSLWDLTSKIDNILHTTVGFDSLLKILAEYMYINKVRDIVTKDYFKELIKPCKELNILNQKRYSFNNRGKKYLYLDMSIAIWPPNPNDPKDKREQELKDLDKER